MYNSIAKTFLFIPVLVLSLFMSSCKKKGCIDPTATNYNQEATQDDGSCTYAETSPQTTAPDNYIKRDGVYYELTEGNIKAGLYDGGPNFYTAVFLNSATTNFVQDSDDVNAFSGQGSGAFFSIHTPDSLENGTFTIVEGWAATNNFDFNNPPNTIYDLNNLPSNFAYTENEQVSFSTISEADSTYMIQLTSPDLEIKYSGKLSFIF